MDFLQSSPYAVAVACIVTYLLGSMPFGLMLALLFCKKDPRLLGSKNTGATNVARECGKFMGFLTLLFDALKGLLPVVFCLYYMEFTVFEASIVALCALLGHTFSIFLRFRGGKGVATTVGVFLGLTFWQLVIAAVLCIAVIYFTGFVSAGSLVLVTSLTIIIALSGLWQALPLAAVVLVLVVYRHRENIQRLLKGEEKPWIKKENSD